MAERPTNDQFGRGMRKLPCAWLVPACGESLDKAVSGAVIVQGMRTAGWGVVCFEPFMNRRYFIVLQSTARIDLLCRPEGWTFGQQRVVLTNAGHVGSYKETVGNLRNSQDHDERTYTDEAWNPTNQAKFNPEVLPAEVWDDALAWLKTANKTRTLEEQLAAAEAELAEERSQSAQRTVEHIEVVTKLGIKSFELHCTKEALDAARAIRGPNVAELEKQHQEDKERALKEQAIKMLEQYAERSASALRAQKARLDEEHWEADVAAHARYGRHLESRDIRDKENLDYADAQIYFLRSKVKEGASNFVAVLVEFLLHRQAARAAAEAAKKMAAEAAEKMAAEAAAKDAAAAAKMAAAAAAKDAAAAAKDAGWQGSQQAGKEKQEDRMEVEGDGQFAETPNETTATEPVGPAIVVKDAAVVVESAAAGVGAAAGAVTRAGIGARVTQKPSEANLSAVVTEDAAAVGATSKPTTIASPVVAATVGGAAPSHVGAAAAGAKRKPSDDTITIVEANDAAAAAEQQPPIVQDPTPANQLEQTLQTPPRSPTPDTPSTPPNAFATPSKSAAAAAVKHSVVVRGTAAGRPTAVPKVSTRQMSVTPSARAQAEDGRSELDRGSGGSALLKRPREPGHTQAPATGRKEKKRRKNGTGPRPSEPERPRSIEETALAKRLKNSTDAHATARAKSRPSKVKAPVFLDVRGASGTDGGPGAGRDHRQQSTGAGRFGEDGGRGKSIGIKGTAAGGF